MLLNNAPSKDQLRSALKKQRRDFWTDLSTHQQVSLNETVWKNLSPLLRRLEQQVVAAYWALPGEVNCLPNLEQSPMAIALPRVEGKNQPLTFHIWQEGDTLQPNRYAILEPLAGIPVQPAAILMPGLAFDRQGYRLGFGGGYYDRTLPLHPKMLKIGLCWQWQLKETLPRMDHDCTMSWIVTEAEVIKV